MSNPSLQAGEIVAERFRIEALIGEGGMGTIYRARHVQLPRVYALKLLKPSLASDPAFVKRFFREAVAASRVIHPNVVNVTDYGQLPDGNYYIAMEHLDGVDLAAELERLGHLPVGRVVEILIQLADALDCCHSHGILHRDLKTENVLLCTIRGRRDVVKLVDFGIARMLGPEVGSWQVTQGGMIFGTPEYLSPEQAMDRDLDGRSDLYAVGVIAFELVTGRPPFTGRYTEVLKAHVTQVPPPPSSLSKEPLPHAYDALVATLLAKDPANRFQSGGELLQELLRLRGKMLGQSGGVAEAGAAGGARRASPGIRVTTEGAWASLAASPVGAEVSGQKPQAGPSREDLSATLRTALAAEEVIRQREIVLRELAYSLVSRGAGDAALGETLGEILGLEGELRSVGEELELLAHQREQSRLEGDEYARALRLLLGDAELRAGDAGEGPAVTVARRLRGHLELLLQSIDARRAGRREEEQVCRARQREKEAGLIRLLSFLSGLLSAPHPGDTDRERRLRERLDHLEAMLTHALDAVR